MDDKLPPRKRRPKGSAWYWRQTDSWYFTPPGTKQRIRLYDEANRPIRGKGNRAVAELGLARVKAMGSWKPRPEGEAGVHDEWTVAVACSGYLEYSRKRMERRDISCGYWKLVSGHLNDLCAFCGELSIEEFQKGHVDYWVESHAGWKSSATRRTAIGVVKTAFKFAQEELSIPNPLRGLEKPAYNPRIASFTEADEQQIYKAAGEAYEAFLFAAIRTGLRPFCELAQLTTADIVETDRGMLWQVKSSKTKKTRKVPVRKEVAELTRRLSSDLPSGFDVVIFRNSRGEPWKKAAGVQSFLQVKKELGWNRDPVRRRFSSYTCRHTFAHRMLGGYWNDGMGCSIEVLAELMGNTPQVAFQHYGREWSQQHQEPLWTAIGAD